MANPGNRDARFADRFEPLVAAWKPREPLPAAGTAMILVTREIGVAR